MPKINFLSVIKSRAVIEPLLSVSAAITLQYLSEELRKTNLPWGLTEEEKLAKRVDWTKKSIKSVKEILKRYQR